MTPTSLHPTAPPHAKFKRIRVIVAGQSAEDINDFGKTYEVIYRLMSATAKQKYCNENFEIDNMANAMDGGVTITSSPVATT